MPKRHTLVAAALALTALVPTLHRNADARPGDTALQAPRPLAQLDPTSPAGEMRTSIAAPWMPLAAGARIPVGSEVRSGSSTIRVALGNGAVVELPPGSSASVSGSIDLVLGPRSSATKTIRLDVRSGELFVVVPPSAAKQAVLCASKDLLVVARAGDSVRVRAVGRGGGPPDLLVGVYAGEALVASQGAWKGVPAAHMAELHAGEHVAEPLALGPAPSWASEVESEGSSLRVVAGEEDLASFTLRWNRVVGAEGYVAEVARDADFRDVLLRSEAAATATPGVVTPPLEAGRYFARVRTRGVSGLPGLAGPTRSLRIARAVLPPGSTRADDVWVLPLGRTVHFEESAGLELALGRHAFYPAPSSFGIGTESSVTARVRLAGEHVSVPIRIAPRTLAAEIEMSPKRAVWPYDPIDIAVRLRDPKRPVAAVEPKLTVRVDITEVPVTWRKDGDVWRARVEPRVPPGPWVVRVDATDPDGNELGRGHLEIAAPSQAGRSVLASR